MKSIATLVLLLTLPSAYALGADFYAIEIAPQTVYPDQTTLLNITLKNLGGEPAYYLRGILDPDDTSPINPIGFAKKYINVAGKADLSSEYFGAVSQDAEIFLQYPIHVDENSTPATYGVPLKLIWKNISLGESTQTLELGITVGGEPNLVIAGIDTNPSRLYPDTEFNLSVKVENIGTGKAEAVQLSLGFPEEFVGERTGFLETIKRDATRTSTFNLKVDKNAASKAYEFTTRITYQNPSGKIETIEKGFDVYVGERGEIDVEIAGVTTSPSKIHPGEDFSLSVQLENIGKQDAKSVRAEIAPTKEFTGERIAFVGSLKEDDLSTAIFEMGVAKAAEPGSYEIKMTVYYTDEKGSEYSDEKYFGIVVSEKPRNTKRTAVGAVLTVLVLGGLYLWRRGRARPE